MKLILIGAGAWGKNYISTLSNFSDIQLTVANRNNWKNLVDAGPDGVIITTGPHAHVEIAKYVLERHIPIMMEKPVALSLQELEPLLSLQHNAPILINYTHLFSDRFTELKNKLSNIDTIFAECRGKGPIRPYSSLFDYGSHCVAMCLYLLNEYPLTIYTTQQKNNMVSAFSINLRFSNSYAYLTVGNNEIVKKMWLETYTKNGSIVYDDRVERAKLDYVLPLTNAIQCFIDLINGKQDDRSGLDTTIKVVKILEECYRQVSEVR